ncbi:MAG: class I SAM-dependent methyltransferase [Gammaproteobacteria bacterium]|nr:class I SAM-dependent methyltransferase [Gammaproteobacteria bacterium]MBU1415554.1 class I SAM-dependent methyltransferase [Gammaproteobacteria bacterium]
MQNIVTTPQAVQHVPERDYSLLSGERQVGRSLDDIRRDHTVRYELAERVIRLCQYESSNILDLFCGNGYGTYLVARDFAKAQVFGVDGSNEAIDMANEYYSLPNNLFSFKRYPFRLPEGAFDFVICFESLEHVEEDHSLLREICGSLKPGGRALISVPNQERHPLEKNPHQFHFRHYRHDDFLRMAMFGFSLESWYGQDVYSFSPEGINTFQLLPPAQMELKQGVSGQVNIFLLRKKASPS